MKKHLRLTALAALLLSAELLTACSGAKAETPQTAEAPSTTETAKTAETVETAPKAETDPDFLITTVAPDGKEYTSTDGINWQCDGEKSSAPFVFLTMTAEDPIRIAPDKYSIVTIHNGDFYDRGEETLSYGLDIELTRLENGKWVKAEIIEENFGVPSIGISIYRGISRDENLALGYYAPVAGRYRLKKQFEDEDRLDYTCYIEFNAVV